MEKQAMGYEEAVRRIKKAGEIGANVLDLSHQELTELPPEIIQLTDVTRLDLSNNQLTELPPELFYLSYLIELDLFKNHLTELPWSLFQATDLRTLILSNNPLPKLPEELFQLPKLTTLGLNDLQLTELPEEITRLTHLEVLFLGDNRLTELPAEIAQLTKLMVLYLSDNRLTRLPREIGQLTDLLYLYLRRNPLPELPEELFQLSKLTKLSLSDLQLPEVPDELFQLTKLTALGLGGLQLTELPGAIGQLTDLEHLNLSNNRLTKLPPEFIYLDKLEELYLIDNPLPLQVDSQTVREYFNSLEELSDLRAKVENMMMIAFDRFGNSLLLCLRGARPLPLKTDSKTPQEYYDSLKETSGLTAEGAVMFIGDDGSGKTSLLLSLRDGRLPLEIEEEVIESDLTKVKEQKHWELVIGCRMFGPYDDEPITEEKSDYPFLSRPCVYTLVLDGRRDERPEYWLNLLKTFGSGSPVLIALNKYDINPSFDLDRSSFKKEYPFIKGYYRTSCKTGQGIRDFRKALKKELAKLSDPI